MGFSFQGAVGPQNITDGFNANLGMRAARDGSFVVQESHGKWAEQASRGVVYHATTLTAGIALIVAATTGNHPTLWNPTTSGFGAEFISLRAGRVSGTDAPGAWYWASTFPAGAAIATGGPIATFTRVAVVNGLIGGAADAVMNWAPAINTYTVAPAFWAPVGVTMFTGTVAAVIAEIQLDIEFDGSIVLGPNAALSLCTQVATSTALYAVDLGYAVIRL
jgi:hypothetical protein